MLKVYQIILQIIEYKIANIFGKLISFTRVTNKNGNKKNYASSTFFFLK